MIPEEIKRKKVKRTVSFSIKTGQTPIQKKKKKKTRTYMQRHTVIDRYSKL